MAKIVNLGDYLRPASFRLDQLPGEEEGYIISGLRDALLQLEVGQASAAQQTLRHVLNETPTGCRAELRGPMREALELLRGGHVVDAERVLTRARTAFLRRVRALRKESAFTANT